MDQKPYDKYILSLAEKWLNGTITIDEENEFAQWYNSFDDEAELLLDHDFAKNEAVLKDRIFQFLHKRLKENQQINQSTETRQVHLLKHNWLRFTAAAAVVGLLLLSAYMLINVYRKPVPVAKTTTLKDVPPGGNKAVLTLADGTSVVLDSLANGKIAQQGKGQVIKLSDGHIAYTAAGVTHTSEVMYNRLITPRGGQQQLGLPDGTQVWLNSASSIRYPAIFTGAERIVEVTGEVYFEVAKNAAMPFKVKINDGNGERGVVTVLGTHFDINAYNDDAIVKTTLLEGSVELAVPGIKLTQKIRPGQQAQLRNNTPIQVMNDVDIEKVMAWKTGFFEFDNTDLSAIMQQVSRWYDVEISFEGKPSGEKFGGRISKSLPLSKILNLLKTNNVEFRLEGRKLIIRP